MSETQVITIPTARLVGNPHQHRRFFDEEKLRELAASLREKGCLENLLVRRNGTPDTFEVVAGERRLRAARIAGLESLPCRVLDVDAAEAYRLSMTENLQRADVSAFEEADGYAVLRDSYRMEVAGIAQAIGKSEGHVRNRLRLCACAAHTRELAVGAWITLGVADALARVQDHEEQARLAQLAATKGWDILRVNRAVALACGEVEAEATQEGMGFEEPTPEEREAHTRFTKALDACARLAGEAWDIKTQQVARRAFAHTGAADLEKVKLTVKAWQKIEKALAEVVADNEVTR